MFILKIIVIIILYFKYSIFIPQDERLSYAALFNVIILLNICFKYEKNLFFITGILLTNDIFGGGIIGLSIIHYLTAYYLNEEIHKKFDSGKNIVLLFSFFVIFLASEIVVILIKLPYGYQINFSALLEYSLYNLLCFAVIIFLITFFKTRRSL